MLYKELDDETREIELTNDYMDIIHAQITNNNNIEIVIKPFNNNGCFTLKTKEEVNTLINALEALKDNMYYPKMIDLSKLDNYYHL